MPYFQHTLDFCSTGYITLFKISRLIKGFGPFNQLTQNVNKHFYKKKQPNY